LIAQIRAIVLRIWDAVTIAIWRRFWTPIRAQTIASVALSWAIINWIRNAVPIVIAGAVAKIANAVTVVVALIGIRGKRTIVAIIGNAVPIAVIRAAATAVIAYIPIAVIVAVALFGIGDPRAIIDVIRYAIIIMIAVAVANIANAIVIVIPLIGIEVDAAIVHIIWNTVFIGIDIS
jgi:hypothetical protein